LTTLSESATRLQLHMTALQTLYTNGTEEKEEHARQQLRRMTGMDANNTSTISSENSSFRAVNATSSASASSTVGLVRRRKSPCCCGCGTLETGSLQVCEETGQPVNATCLKFMRPEVCTDCFDNFNENKKRRYMADYASSLVHAPDVTDFFAN
jgi:hypothetical protein